MFVTRKMDYAMRVLLTLGCRPDERLTSEELSGIIEVPRQFTLKIAQTLTKAGLITAKRGVGGGLELARAPDEISLLDVFKSADTPRSLNGCLLTPESCARAPYCAGHHGLRNIQAILDRELKKTTLADLVRHQSQLDRERGN